MTRRRTVAAVWAVLAFAPSLAPPSRAQDAPQSFALPPVDAFRAMIERPPFVQGRRGTVAPPGDPPELPGEAPLRLIGLLTDRSGRAVALVRRAPGTTERRLAPGAEVEGWTVASIGPAGLELAAGPMRLTIGIGTEIPPAP